MRRLTIICCLLFTLDAYTQLGFEPFYRDTELIALLQQAKTPEDQLEANGYLASNYKAKGKDSLAKTYLEKIRAIAAGSANIKIKSRALWWDNYYEPDTNKARRFIDFAVKNNLVEDRIVGHIELTRVYIHINLDDAEKNALTAKRLWDEWRTDSVHKDSVKLEVLKQLAHVYIHRRDGIKAVGYLLPLQDYASQDKNEMLKEVALNGIAMMYYEWPGQYKKATEWVLKVYEFYKKSGEPHKELYAVIGLATQYCNIGDTVKARNYCAITEKLMDSIGAKGEFADWYFRAKYAAGLITLQEFAILIDKDFGNRYFVSPAKKVYLKLGLYSQAKQMDSIKWYLLLYQKLTADSSLKEDYQYKYLAANYYQESKQYKQAIPLLNELKEKYVKESEYSAVEYLYTALARSYAGIGDHQNSYEYLKKAYQLKDSVEKLSSKEEVSLLEMQKQQEMQATAYQAERSRVQFNNRVRLYALLGGVFILVLVAILLWRNNMQKQRSKLKIENAYAELKSTQAQLIQSEKMASLGELTAGIAHEIQNPLNFVNNFSEVNTELMAEMKEEIQKGNIDEVKAIAKDVKDNEEKINHHGKRADAIVKGMLQHSRSSNGAKEPTDINALADEYLRLAYHGLRAKDKSFNATTKTDFDESIGKIKIIPQDIGRVILNLITNAFYVVAEKKKEKPDGYEPTVKVSTKRQNDKVEIRVKDNGNGIPQKVLDKIFQPFFTTKPTGQGTGLGLSLSYDIIKAHGGELKVETKEGEGAEFKIILPV